MRIFEGRFDKCKKIISETEKADCLYVLLNNITNLQDEIQLEIPRINKSVEYSKSLTNSANALLLDASRWKGDIRPQLNIGYIRKHIDNIVRTYNNMGNDVSLALGTSEDQLVCKHVTKSAPSEGDQELRQFLFEHQDKLAIQ